MEDKYLLKIDKLKVDLMSVQGIVHAVRGVSLQVKQGEIHGIVGESGCGKSMTIKSIMRLHSEDRVRYGGSILFGEEQKNILELNKKEIRKFLGKEVSMIFQDPMVSLNPIMKVGKQIEEMIMNQSGVSRAEAKERILDIFRQIRIMPPEERYEQYPFEMSGGLLQRIMIAMAVSCHPDLLIADEPTTALDVTIQDQILKLMKRLQKESNMSIIIVTHNLGVIAEICDFVSVMYAGRVVESAPVVDLFDSPRHPYTMALIDSNPKYGQSKTKMATIVGTPPSLVGELKGCPFAERCKYAKEICRQKEPELVAAGPGRQCACHRMDEIGKEGVANE